MYILSPLFPITNDAVTLLIVNNSSAAFAQIIFMSLSFSSQIAIAMVSFVISAFATILEILLYVSKSLWNHFFTVIISTPHFLKYAAASNVLTPVLNVKFFVSIIIPAYKASASNSVSLTSASEYSIISVTSSAAEDAYTSWNVSIASSIKSVLLL